MGNPSWGKGYHTGYDKGYIRGVVALSSIILAKLALSAIGAHITKRKLKAEIIIENKGK